MAYATAEDLQNYLGLTVEMPQDADRLLERASELIDVATLGNIDAGDEMHQEAARKATCAQVEFWMQVGEELAITGPVQGIQIGSLQIQYGAGDSRISPTDLAPRARRYLFMAGLLYRGIRQVSRTNALADQFFRPPGGW